MGKPYSKKPFAKTEWESTFIIWLKTNGNHIPMAMYFDKKPIIDMLKELTEAAHRGELKKAAFRVYRTDGTFEDIVVGAESEEERQELLAGIDSSIKSGSH